MREGYDNLVKTIVPTLTMENAGVAIDGVNKLVRLHRPSDWEFSEEPRVVLGMTSDKKGVAYGETTQFGFYHVLPPEELHKILSRLLEKKQMFYQGELNLLNVPAQNETLQRECREGCQPLESLLRELVALRG